MSRRVEEFYCDKIGGGCQAYFLTYLRTNMTGNFTIECPRCGHHHFRFIDGGLVTGDRHNDRGGQAEIIMGLKSTVREVPYHNDPTFRRSTLRAYHTVSPRI